MTPRQQRFIAEYLIDSNATQAAIRAGFSKRTAHSAGPRLLANVEVARAIAEDKKRIAERCDLTAARVLEELRRLAFCDPRSFFDAAGNLKPLAELTSEQGSALASFEVIKKNAEAGDGIIDTVHKFKLWDKTRALEMVAKYFGLLTEKVEHSGDVSFRWLTPDEKSS